MIQHTLLAFHSLIRSTATTPYAQQMKKYTQHGCVSTYTHCMNVSLTSYILSRAFRLALDESALVRGAFLHDYFLYDWHDHGDPLHGFHHPAIAVRNAQRDFHISEKEASIIASHMWPLTLREVPRSREAIIVCLADKLCAFRETVWPFRPK